MDLDPGVDGVDLASRVFDWVDDAADLGWSEVSGDWDSAYLALLAEVEADGVQASRHPMSGLSYEDLIEVITDSERVSRAAIARGCVAVAELARRTPAGGLFEDYQTSLKAGTSPLAPCDVAAAMGVSRRSAELRVHEAVTLDARLPRTLAALSVGLLGMPAARVLVTETTLLDDATVAVVESRVLDKLGAHRIPGLGQLTPTEIRGLTGVLVDRVGSYATTNYVRRLTRRAVAAVDADAVRARKAAAPGTRTVELTSSGLGDGMSWVAALLPDEQAWAVYERLELLARAQAKDPGETRRVSELRADFFAEFLLAATPGVTPAERTPIKLQVLIAADGGIQAGRLGVISEESLDRLIGLATTTGGTVTVRTQEPVGCPGAHPDGGANDAYEPSAGLRRAVQLRDMTCVFPGCTITATSCDLDHTIPWPHGPTCECNLGALCRHHHRLKTHHHGWGLVNHGHGRFTWTTPWHTTLNSWPGSELADGDLT